MCGGEDGVELLETGELPVGVVGGLEPVLLSKKLWEENWVILVSDGILDALPGDEKELVLREFLEGAQYGQPQQLAEDVLGFASSFGEARDDIDGAGGQGVEAGLRERRLQPPGNPCIVGHRRERGWPLQMDLERKVAETIEREHMIERGGHVVAAISGGADSACLLRVLGGLSASRNFTLEALHVHHGLRGQEADRDEAFVRELCGELGVPPHREA